MPSFHTYACPACGDWWCSTWRGYLFECVAKACFPVAAAPREKDHTKEKRVPSVGEYVS